jgi:HlyD family secretion protein
VTPKLSAPVKRMLVNRGDHVRAGQVVAELETSDLAASAEESKHQLEQAQAAYQTMTGATVPEDKQKSQSDVQTARAGLDGAKKVYESRAALQREGALAQKLVDDARVVMVQAQSQLDTAQRHLEALNQVSQRESIRSSEAQVNAAKSHYDSALVQVSYGLIRSPINGVVADRSVSAGEVAASGSQLLSIMDVSQVIARANVSVKDAVSIRVGRPARIAGPDGDLAGKVTVVSPAVDPNTTTVEVWVAVPNPGEKLKPGSAVRVSIVADTIQNTIVVPASALLNADEGGAKVMVIDKASVAHERKITLGVRQNDRVQVTSGLQEGEQVVTSGGLGLEDNAKVTIQAAKSDDDEDAPAEGAPPPAQSGAQNTAPDTTPKNSVKSSGDPGKGKVPAK